jgi:hypothetical protein
MYEDYIEEAQPLDNLDQCQIFKDIYFGAVGKKILGILVSSTCDFVNKKLRYLAFCAVLPFDVFFLNRIEKTEKIPREKFFADNFTPGQKKQMIEFIKEMVGIQYPRYHWIGIIPGYDGYWYIDYQLIQTMSFTRLEGLKADRVAKIITPFKESVFVSYSSYVGRVGLKGEIEDRLIEAEKVFEDIKTRS